MSESIIGQATMTVKLYTAAQDLEYAMSMDYAMVSLLGLIALLIVGMVVVDQLWG
jgi:hypothetical protein